MFFSKIKSYLSLALTIIVAVSFSFSSPIVSSEEVSLTDSTDPLNKIIVKFNQKILESEITRENKLSAEDVKATIGDNTFSIQTNSKEEAEELIESLNQSRGVEYAELNRPVQTLYTPDDPFFTNDRQWYLKDASDGIYAESAWDILGNNCSSNANCGGNSSVSVAVIDSGVDPRAFDSGNNIDRTNAAHISYGDPENKGNCRSGANIVPGSGICLATGEDALSDFSYENLTIGPDTDGHGTAVSSIISMVDNNNSGIGIGYNLSLMPINVLQLTTENIALGIYYAIDNGAKVINMSLGTPFDSAQLRDAVDFAVNNGALIVSSAGNCGNRFGNECFNFGSNYNPGDPGYNDFNPIIYPGAYNNSLTVGALQTNNGTLSRSSYSTFGSQVDISAPVNNANTGHSTVVKCVYSSGFCAGRNRGETSTFFSGTSAASPIVAAAAGLVYSYYPNLTPSQVSSVLTNNTNPIANNNGNLGAGSLDICKALGGCSPEVPNCSAGQLLKVSLIIPYWQAILALLDVLMT